MDFEEFREKLKEDLGERLFARTGEDYDIISSSVTKLQNAGYMGVSDKTVEAWEAGTNHPSGAASRILRMMEMDKELVFKFPFVKSATTK